MDVLTPRQRHYLMFDSRVFRDDEGVFDPLHFESFLDRLASAFQGNLITTEREKWTGQTSSTWVVSTQRLRIGLARSRFDYVYVSPLAQPGRNAAVLSPFGIESEVRAGFNALIESCVELKFTRFDRSGKLQIVTRYDF